MLNIYANNIDYQNFIFTSNLTVLSRFTGTPTAARVWKQAGADVYQLFDDTAEVEANEDANAANPLLFVALVTLVLLVFTVDNKSFDVSGAWLLNSVHACTFKDKR